MQPPATQESIDRLIQRTKRELIIEIPPTYVHFLKEVNGLNWNGLTIYGTETLPLLDTKDIDLLGLVEANEIWREYEENKAYVYYGEGNISRYGLKISTGEYVERDKPGHDEFEIYKNFEAMLTKILQKCLD